MVTGAIAYARLQEEDPAALARVLELLRQHPHYEALLRAPEDWRLDADDDLALFMWAARWADDVRSEPFDDYSEGWWHYVNYHYRDGRLTEPGNNDGRLLWALNENHRGLAQGDAEDRAVALTWMFHLVGDVHQPLHTIANHAPAHPDGDRGGNLFHIRVSENSDTINMHRLWDGLVIGTDRFTAVRQRGIDLRHRPGLTPPELEREAMDLDFESWARDGAQLAADYAYRGGTLRSGTREKGMVLPADYNDTVQPLAEKRATPAGYRLARILGAAF